jgi:signal transduction histidine kinase
MDRVFDRVLLVRHFALSLGAVAAYVFRSELRVGYTALWIVGISASLNFLAWVFRTRPSLARLCMIASPVIGVVGWAALVAVTSGVRSPFIAGLWLEIMLSAMALEPRGIVFVSVGSVLLLWVQQVWLGLGGVWLQMLLQSGFLVGMGLAAYLVTRRWTRRQQWISRQREELGVRLDSITRELADERTVAALGENVARLAHGLKNTVHSLRGFVKLIEPRLDEQSREFAALRGLRSAIDDLEALAHLTLGSRRVAPGTAREAPVAKAEEPRRAGPSSLPAAIEEALGQVSRSHPEVVWETKSDGICPLLPLPEASFTEMLVILMRNAVEAMSGRGRGQIETWVEESQLHVMIRDEGIGFVDVDVAQIFKPGFTTKVQGSGYGLFLARRMIEEHGGHISAKPGAEQGAMVELSLPIAATAEPRTSR